MAGQLAAEARERKTDAKAGQLSEFARIKQELDARRLLAHVSKSHGVIPEKYEVTKGKDGADRIKAGSRNLNVSDFLTQEMRLSFSEAAPILRQVYASQQGRAVAEPRQSPKRDLWEAFRASQPDRQAQKTQEWKAQREAERERRDAIRTEYQARRQAVKDDKGKKPAERKAELSIVRMARVAKDMDLRESIQAERQALKDRQRQPYQERYRAWLADRAGKGDENALAELRRQRAASPAPEAVNTIEGDENAEKKRRQLATEPLARNLAYSVDRAGNVTYYTDQEKRRPVLIDSGRQVTVTAPKDAEAIEAGLRLAMQKFGPKLKIEGSAEFRRQVVDVAARSGLKIEFADKKMNEELARSRADRDALQARGKAFIAASREVENQPKQPAPPASEKARESEEAERTQRPHPKERDHER